LSKPVPHNLEAERALLGFILLDNSALNAVVEQVSREDFFSESHRRIFQKMLDLSENNRKMDTVTLSEELTREGWLEKVGGVVYLAGLSEGVPFGTSANITEYSRIIRDKSLLRSIIHVSENAISRAQQNGDDPKKLATLTQSELVRISEASQESPTITAKEAVRKTWPYLEAVSRGSGMVYGTPTGFESLDTMLCGWIPKDLVILAGRPGKGKTALGLELVRRQCKAGNGAVVISLEMSTESLVARILCREARVSMHKMMGGFLSNKDYTKELILPPHDEVSFLLDLSAVADRAFR